MFAEGKELGERGLRWLKIHCANLAGYDKASFAEREKFIDEHLEDVFDSADNPTKVGYTSPLSDALISDNHDRAIDGGLTQKTHGSVSPLVSPSRKH